MNTRQKGNRNQRKCIEYLENLGWKVSKAEQGGKFNKEKDLFGLFDLVAFRAQQVMFVQVTTNVPHTHKNYKAFADEHGYSNIIFKQFVWYDRQGWKIFTYTPYKKWNEEDLRKNAKQK